MNMTELAKKAGVSLSTVSKAFSGAKDISSKKREEIFALAKKEGCFKKFYKTALQHPVIGIICPEFNADHYSELLSSLHNEIGKQGGIAVVGCNDFKHENTDLLLTYFTEYTKVDGIIMLCSYKSKIEYKIPIVALGENDSIDSIRLSDESAFDQVIKHLIENGHKHIAFLSETLTAARLKCFRSAMEKNSVSINEDYIITENARFEKAGYNGMNKLLSLSTPPTAVIAAYDNIAIGAMKSIYEHGKKIPEDISLIGIDNISKSAFLPVSLSSITEYCEDLCQIMVRVLFERMSNPKGTSHKSIKITKEFVKRDSVGKTQ